MTHILFGMVAMLGYGLSNAMAQVPSKRIGTKRSVFYRGFVVSAVMLVFLMALGADATTPGYVLMALGIAVIGYIPLLMFYKALQAGKVGVVSPIANSSGLFTVLFALIFFNETLAATHALAILAILLGIVLVSTDFHDFRNSQLFTVASGIPFALISCLLWGLVFFLVKIPVNVLGPILTSFLLEFGVFLASAINIAIQRIPLKVPERSTTLHVIFMALTGATGTLAYNYGISLGAVSIIAAITFANPLVTTIYGRFVYKESLSRQQYAAISIIIAGIVALSYFQ